MTCGRGFEGLSTNTRITPHAFLDGCNEEWSDKKVERGVAKSVAISILRKVANPTSISRSLTKTNMHFGDPPDILEPAHPAEKMLLSPVHCSMSVLQVCGGQYEHRPSSCKAATIPTREIFG